MTTRLHAANALGAERRLRAYALPVVALAAIILCLVVLTHRYTQGQVAAVKAAAEGELLTVLDLQEGRLRDWYRERLGNAVSLQNSVFVRDGIEWWLRGDVRAGTRADIEAWLRTFGTRYGYSRVAIARTDGILAAQWPHDPETRLAARDLERAREAHRSRSPVLSRSAEHHQAPLLHVFVPLWRQSDGAPVATLVMEVEVGSAISGVARWPVPRRTAMISVLEWSGDSWHYVSRPARGREWQVLPIATVGGVIEHAGVMQTLSTGGREIIAAARPIAGTRWAVLAQVDEDEVLALARARGLAAVLLVALVSVALSLAAGVLLALQARSARVREETLRRSVEAQLAHADRMASIGTLAAGVAHEINNPLAFVLANVGYAEEELANPRHDAAEVRQALAEAREGARRVRQIVLDLKTFAREDPHARSATDLREAIRFALSLVQNEIRHRARVEMAVEEALPPVSGSEHRIGQVLVNLLVNAAHAIESGHASENVVRISGRRTPAGTVEIAVSDTGVGIAPDILPRIFEPFFTTKRVGGGTGLGLSICHGIVSGLGGSIRVESTPGAGSTFFVELPAAAPAGADRNPPKPAAAAVRARVLVVDDEPLVCRTVARVLGDCDVDGVQDGAAALARLVERRYDLVLCDIMMPDTTGAELFATLEERFPDVAERVVFLTGGPFTEETQAFVAQARPALIQKPFEPDQLRDAVNAALAASSARGADPGRAVSA